MSANAQTQQVIWFSRIVRWVLGSLFILTGLKFLHQDGWPAIVFGGVIFITGFFKPRHCVGGECAISTHRPEQ